MKEGHCLAIWWFWNKILFRKPCDGLQIPIIFRNFADKIRK